MYLFWHSLSLVLVNAWMRYRRHCALLHVPKGEILIQRKFQASVAKALIEVNTAPKRGRPSLEQPAPKRRRPLVQLNPVPDVQKDQLAHWPVKDPKRGRCKICIQNKTKIRCEKCSVYLCLTDDRNCFRQFHV